MTESDAGANHGTLKAEVHHVVELVDHHQYKAAARALRDDSNLNPAQLKAFYAELKSQEKEGHHLHPLEIADTDAGGVKISAKEGHGKTKVLFEQSPIGKDAADEPVPSIGKLLEPQGLTAQMGDHIQDIQKHKVELTDDEKAKIDKYKAAHGGKDPKFLGELAVALYSDTTKVTDQIVKEALDKQMHLFEEKARAIVEESTRTLPFHEKEGPFQYLKRVHPEMHDPDAVKLARVIRDMPSRTGVIKEGEPLETIDPAEVEKRTTEKIKELRSPRKREDEVIRERTQRP
jgi:hypothetical protein